MEFCEKLQQLRKNKGLTQEGLAESLFVSRTAISKWESGRGYPNIDSLKEIARFFSVSIDELLSGTELLTLAEEDVRQKEKGFRDLVFGMLDACVALLLFLPLFAQRLEGVIEETSLLSLDGVSIYLKIAYYVLVVATAVMGILTLALQNTQGALWVKSKAKISLVLGTALVLLFIISSQPYASAFAFALLAIKALVLIKR
ncbi:MAG: helix-turn-helix transcriptional regulator [Clostridia bacterium]|nr:helix-turn-helix transcriptional regulator [Clostridia bacterium]